jgi:hypothetical protein
VSIRFKERECVVIRVRVALQKKAEGARVTKASLFPAPAALQKAKNKKQRGRRRFQHLILSFALLCTSKFASKAQNNATQTQNHTRTRLHF